jgi:hypothetical protein
MAKNTISVRLEVISYGGWKNLEVAIDVNQVDGKTLYLTFSAVEKILNYPPDSVRKKLASKSLETFLGGGQAFGKISGRIANVKGAIAKVNLIHLDDFLSLATWEAVVNQNIEIGKTLATGLGDSIRSLAYEQLGIDLKQEERHHWIETRNKGKQVRYSLTDAIKWWLENNEVSDNTRKWIYANCSDAVNLGLFGRKASKLCVDLQVPDKNKLRDALTDKELLWLSEIEHLAARLIIRQGWEPVLAVKEAIDRLVLDRVSRSAMN